MDLNHQLRTFSVLLVFLSICHKFSLANKHHHRIRHERGRLKRQEEQHEENHYIIIDQGQNEIDSENWGPWSAPSPCSRSCGGGVSYQTRTCPIVRPDGRPGCTGGSKKYFSCNIQNCEEGSHDFRGEQCSEFNSVPFEGVHYDWIPYTKAPNKCELNCMPRGERFYYRHKNQVIDGTPCDEENNAICVEGQCLPVGCDRYLGSPAREDKCRVCRGSGKDCTTTHNILDTNNLEMGYNDLLLIPAGATNILVKEVRPSNNYLAIRNTSGHYYLNGNWRIDFPRTLPCLGTNLHYERRPHDFFSPEKITAAGPISEAIYIVLLYQEPNPGIEYEYSIPNGTVQQTSPSGYSWNYDKFTPCSTTCGGGFKTRNVWCSSQKDPQAPVSTDLCDPALEPLRNQTCNLGPCPPSWHVGNWSDCSKICGIGGEQTREVYCKQTVAAGQETKIEDSQCESLIGPKVPTTQSCNDTLPCPEWHIGPWKPCDHLCGEGKQIRSVRCFRRVEGRIQTLGDSACKNEKPPTEKSCNLRSCEGVDWVTSDWSDCEATCGLTTKTRSVICASAKGTVHAESECIESKRPENVSECENIAPCEYLWYTSEWSQCSAQCGSGVQTRQVFCGQRENNTVTVAEDDKCNSTNKSPTSQNCTGPEVCKGSWFAGPWSACSKKCGGGDMSRKVLCFIGNTSVPASSCDEEKILFTSEGCNTHPCNEDEVITVDPKSSLEEDESEEECEEEEDEEVTASTPSSFSEAPVTETSTLGITEIEGSGDGTELPITGTSSDVTSSSDEASEGTTPAASPEYQTSYGTFVDSDDSTTPSDSSAVPDLTTIMETATSESSTPLNLPQSDDADVMLSDDANVPAAVDSSSTKPLESSTILGTTDSSSEIKATVTTDDETTSSSVSGAPSDSSPNSAEVDSASTSNPLISSASSAEGVSGDGTDDDSASSVSLPQSSVSSSDETEASLGSSPSVESTSDDTLGSSLFATLSSLLPSSESDSSTEPTVVSSSTDDVTATTAESVTSTGASSTDVETTSSDVLSTTPNTYTDLMTKDVSLKKCKKKKKKKADCQKSEFGCCFDGITAAKGPFSEDCNIITTCNETQYGCCQDGVSPATGPDFENCPASSCNETLFGCCPDGFTPAEGNDKEGCPKEKPPPPKCASSKFGCCSDNITAASGKKFKGCPDSKKPDKIDGKSATCATSKFGCCPDGKTSAKGKSFEGCKEINSKNCTASFFGCCPDGATAALGTKQEGCPAACKSSRHGCCDDGITPAHGPNKEGCCLITPHGCCPDNVSPAQGPDFYGCDCQYAAFGCCPDNKTIARGPANEGCGCQHTTHGCCPDKYTPALGPSFQGCPCYTYQFGCCPDGITRAKGPRLQGCGCENTQFGCCSDERTPASNAERNCSCEATKFGCCLDGVSEAKGEDFKGCDVVPEKRGRVCSEPKDRGSCRDFTVKWFFDTDYGGCSRFWYGGCEGNNNRFKSQEECRGVCVEPTGKEACYLPKITGPCEGYYPTWYYDSERQQCAQFIYGGCLGNNNKFQTREECQQLCSTHSDQDSCEQPTVEGPCRGQFTRWTFDKASQSCTQFNYGGCQGNDNNFLTQNACHQRCLQPGRSRDECSLPRVQGSCGERLPRWFFDASENRCMPFYFSGCDGNGNNFDSQETCETFCPPKIEKDLCLLPAVAGECSNYVERWYYDSLEASCKPFYFGGCGGNLNNFVANEDCQARCDSNYVPKALPPPPSERTSTFSRDSCFLPSDSGPCRNVSEALWFYDSHDGVCKQFLYGGCEGNGNRFSTRNECEERCGYVQDLCELPKVVGPCNANYRSWYYDINTDTCQAFDYGGCQGNANRFEEERSCLERCVRDRNKLVATPVQTPVAPVAPVLTTPAPAETNVCFISVDPGPCLQETVMWYFDSSSKSCSQFMYGGCEGNANRFASEEECDRYCGYYKEAETPSRETPAETTAEDPKVEAEEGYYVTLKCSIVMYPDPIFIWTRGNTTIDQSTGRMRIQKGSLQIIGLYRQDAGIYICTADNSIQPPISKEFNLVIRDPVSRPAQIIGEESTSVTVTLGLQTVLQCYAIGWPRPTLTWWRGEKMLPLSSEQFEQQQENSLLIHRVSISNLGPYTCQAYNGLGRAASWTVILRAVGTAETEEDARNREYLIPPSPSQYNRTYVTAATTTAAPERETPRVYIVPVTANVSLSSQVYPVGAHISIPCDTDGYPIPQVSWYKDNYQLENSDRIRITESNRLIISKAEASDSGTYRCTASNPYSSAESSVYISVTGVYVHPSCTDSPFFANCKLIVRAQYCTHKYYEKFCCKSCTEAGLLPPLGPHLDLSNNSENTEAANYRKRRSISSGVTSFILSQHRQRHFKSKT